MCASELVAILALVVRYCRTALRHGHAGNAELARIFLHKAYAADMALCQSNVARTPKAESYRRGVIDQSTREIEECARELRELPLAEGVK